MTVYGYGENTPTAAALTNTWSRTACDVGNTLVLFVQHALTGSTIAITDNSGGTNVWTRLLTTNDLGATTQRNVDMWWCKPTVKITSITATASAAAIIIMTAEDLAGNTWTVRDSDTYFDSTRVCPPLTTVAGDTVLGAFAYNATTGGTSMITAMSSPWAFEGLNYISTVQLEQWKIPAGSTTSGSQLVTASGSPTMGAVYASLYVPSAQAANVAPTITAGSTVVMSSGTSTTITVQGNDSDGTISSFTPSILSNTMTTTPTFGTQTVTNAGTANASSSIPVNNLSPGDLSIRVIDTDDDGAVSATPATCRIVYTSTAPKVRSVTLNSVTMTSPTSGTPKDALNAWLANPSGVAAPVFQATSSPPASGAGVIVAYQPLDSALALLNFGHTWASDGSTSLTVYVDLKFGGVTRATKSLTITSTTPTFVGRDITSSESTAIGTDRSLPSVESRFA
jgi:hypothetical protein